MRRTLITVLMCMVTFIALSLSGLFGSIGNPIELSRAFADGSHASRLALTRLLRYGWDPRDAWDALKERNCVMPSSAGHSSTDSVNEAQLIIPDVFHLIRFNQPVVSFVEMLAIKSILRLNPCRVVIHCNNYPEGPQWDLVKADKRIVVVYREPPLDIFGIKPNWIQHTSDLVRIQVLREYGGIYMDNDCIMLRSVAHLRKHRCVVAKSKKEQYLGNMFAMATPDCRYLVMYENLYRTSYDPNKWYYNAGELPTTEILDKHPEVAVVVDQGIEMDIIHRLFIASEPVEKFTDSYDVLHTFYNHRYVVNDTTNYDGSNFRRFNTSFSNIANWLLKD